MNPEYKRKWLEALRSGEYRQHQGSLCNEDHTAFCCIGVGAVANGLPYKSGKVGNTEVAKKSLGIDYLDDALVNMNDSQGLDFPTIANWIEENL